MLSKKKVVFGSGGVVLLAIAWYAFRPELLFVNKKVDEGLVLASPMGAKDDGGSRLLASGRFHGVAHEGRGGAAIHEVGPGRRVLRFTDFETSNGPDLQVYLVATADAKDSDTVKTAGFVTLGALKGNQGSQNYDVPAEVDLGKYRAVTVWCRRFGVNFATAPLTMAGAMQDAGMVEPGATMLLEGRFHDGAHQGKGRASVYRLADGRRVLRLSDFETSNGPDLQLYLVAAVDAKDNDTVKTAGFVTLGALKGNQGNQNYDVPAEVDLGKYQAVTVWCRRFGVNFTTAPLAAPR